MSEESHKTIWLSGSESYPAQATQCQAVLDAIGVRVASGHVLKPGEHAAEQTAAEIESAAGIIILLGPKWTTQTDPKEVACIEAQCSQKASLWIIYIAATLDPPVLQKLLVLARGTQRLPRSGNTLTRLSVQKRRVVLEELARSVAAQLELPLPRDAQYRQLQDYRRTRYEQLEFVPLRGFFGAQHVDAARAFRFTELFVSPRLEWLRQPASIAEQYRRLSAQIEDQRLSAQERWDLEMQRSALASRYGQGAVAKLEEILHRHPQIMLLGKPGSGKSTILHSLELQAHRCDAELAIQIKLQSIAERAGHGESLWPQVLQKIRSEHGSVVAEAFEEWADQGRALLLLDGVDEVQAEHRAKLLSTVEKMLLGRQKLRCVVTSRLANDCWLNAQISHLQVADFNPDEIAAFVRKHKHCEDQATAEGRAEHLVTVIQASSELQELAHNPLLLRLLCLLDQGDDGLPRDLVTVYEYAIHTLLETWPANRVARRVRVSPAELRNALASTAAWMHVRGCREADRADLLQQLAKALPSAKAQTAEKLAAYCLNVATEHAGILVEVSPNKFEFLHLTFTEYLAADHYVRQNKLPFLAAQRGDSRYAQVIRFAAGILSHVHRRESDATEFLRALMAEPPGSTDQIRHPHLPLAAECLGDGSRFPPDLVDDLLAYLLRAATVPLRSLTASVERTLDALRFPASAKVIAATAALLHHPLNSLRLAVARFLARNTINRPDAQALCLELLVDQNTAIACHAALGLLRAGSIPETHRIRITVCLSHAFDSKIAATDEVEQALRTLPQIAQVAEELYSVEHPRYQVEAARILSLLRPGDWTLLRLLLEKGHDENERAVAYAALRSEDSAERIVDTFLGNEQRSSYGPSALASVLHAIFPDSTAVRRRFLFHYKRPLPETASSSEKNTPERRSVEAAAAYFHDLTRAGEAKARHRAALLPDLRQLLHDADTDLCRRIATLGGELRAPTDWLRDAITPCMQAGGIYRVWAINFAFEQKLYDLAVVGVMARAETPGCLAAAVQDVSQRVERHGGDNKPIILALERQPAGMLRDALLLLCRVNSGREAPEKLYPLLQEPNDALPSVLCWWAASEIIFWARRSSSQIPMELTAAILALSNVTWLDPPDLQLGYTKERRSRPWVPTSHSRFDTMLWTDNGALQLPTGSSVEAAETVRTALRWMYRLAGEGAEHRWHYSSETVQWFRETLYAHLPVIDDIIQGLVASHRIVCGVSEAVLRTLLWHSEFDRSAKNGLRRVPPAKETKRLRQRVLQALSDAPPRLRWCLVELLDGHGLERPRLLAALASFLTEDHELLLRCAALLRLSRDELVAREDAHAVLRAALAAEVPGLRFDAVELIIDHTLPGLGCFDALRPLLAPSAQPTLRLQAAALWLRLPNADQAVVLPVLIDLLVSLDPPGDVAHHRIAHAHRCLFGPHTKSESQRSENDQLAPYNPKTGVGFWAAALLVELGDHEDALRSAAISWLAALPAKFDDEQPWSDRRELTLRLLHRIGVGSAVSAVDGVLLNMLVAESDHPQQSLYWIRQLGRMTEPMLDHLLPMMLRAYWDSDKKILDWVMTLVENDPAVRRGLEASLVSALRDRQSPARYYAKGLLCLLSKFGLIDEEAAKLYVDTTARGPWRTHEMDAWFSDLVFDPIIRRHMLAALDSHAPHECMKLLDWLLPISSLVPKDGSPVPSLALDVESVLRAWLTHPDYGLRIEAGERLYLCGHRDAAVMTAMRSCLETPLDWIGTYCGDGARRTAVETLLRLQELTPNELMDSLLPILSSQANHYDLESTIRLLANFEVCHSPTLEALRNATQGGLRLHFSTWLVVQQTLRIGLPDVERVQFLLRVLAEEPFSSDQVRGELHTLLFGSVQPSGETDPPAARDGESMARKRFQFSPIRGAAVLADLPKWPALVLTCMAELIPCSIESLRSLEKEGPSLDHTKAVPLLESLLHHQAPDSSTARMLRYACLLRFGPLVGISLEQLPYELIN